MHRILFGIMLFFCLTGKSAAQNVYELRKLTEDDWLKMSTDERMRALGAANKHERNQTFVGDFGRHYDINRRWGYEFYEMEDRYESYAFRNFEAYNILEERRRRWSYNEFGDRIAKMGHNARIWKEVHYGDGTFNALLPFHYMNTAGYMTRFFDGIWVAKESTNDWAVSVIGAGALRKSFTPLTFSNPSLHGMCIDFQSANTSVSLINTVLMGAHRTTDLEDPTLLMIIPMEENDLYDTGGAMLRGGRFRRKLGALTLGATYVNSYGVQGNRERGNEWRGTVGNYTPTPLMVAVRFLDDSPDDGGGGPVVYDVRLRVNGRYRDDIQPMILMDDTTLDRTSAITDRAMAIYLSPGFSRSEMQLSFDQMSISERVPKYADYLYLDDLIKGYNSENVDKYYSTSLANAYYSLTEHGGKPIRVNGTEAAVYLFDLANITEKINRIEAVATVANDYRIQTAMIYSQVGTHDTYGKPSLWYKATWWRTAAQAEGNIRDGSNVRTVSVDFGFQVASIIYGFDADFNYLGFKMRSEFVTNASHYMFPDGAPGAGAFQQEVTRLKPRTGHHWSQKDHAYYVTMQKDWKRFGFAGEIFRMGKNYRPYLDYYYGFRSGVSGTLKGPHRYMDSHRNGFTRLPLIEDNDDDDFYPDTMSVLRYYGYEILDYEDPDGVFPGNDEDNDSIPDNNKNNNREPDWEEPFLMFDSDPDEFVFGDDFNNNTIPDFREDDMKLDTPYDLDRQGYHVNVRYTPHRNLDLIAGSLRSGGIGTSGTTNDDYFKMKVHYDVFGVGKLSAEYRNEHIRDNIRDPYVQVQREMHNYVKAGFWTIRRYDRELYFDELEYRNSRVNRLFLDSKIRALPSITMENHARFERNSQIEGTMYDRTYQPHDVVSTLAMVNKIAYTKRLGNFVFSPGIKYRFYKKARSESLQPLGHYLIRIPLVMFKYIVSPATDISFGMQGLKYMPFRFTDYVQKHNNYRRITYTLQLQNKTRYFGYIVWGSVGFTLDQVQYDKKYRHFEEYKTSTTFVNVNLGW